VTALVRTRARDVEEILAAGVPTFDAVDAVDAPGAPTEGTNELP
jgi:hypothetical protein